MRYTERLAQLLYFGIIGLCVLGAADLLFDIRPRDDSDTAERRSGLRPHADALTGCQYLSVAGGGVIARLAADGKQIGCRP